MKISVLTPTRNRPEALALAERWLRQQTRPADQWVVVDGSDRPAGVRNLVENLLAGLERVTGDVVVFWEDDDYYAPTHLATVAAAFDAHPAAWILGDQEIRTYHLGERRWRWFQNKGWASLCQTALRMHARAILQRVLEAHRASEARTVDLTLWQHVAPCLRQTVPLGTVVGLRWPEDHALGRWHDRSTGGWIEDDDGAQLRAWLGPDAHAYHEVSPTLRCA